jgi:hypothetical protein
MMKVVAIATFVTSLCVASAFAPVKKGATTTNVALNACISKKLILKTPNTIETGKMWDPLGLAEIGGDETMAWYRHSEIK